MNSVAGRSAHGPVAPNGLMVTTTWRGAARRAATASKCWSATTMSASLVSVLVLTDGDRSLRGVQEGEQAAGPDRRSSAPPGGSTNTTSAPASARSFVQYGPATPRVRSTTRTPARDIGPLLTDDRGRKYGRLTPSPTGRKIDLDVQPDGDVGGIAVDDVGQHLVTLVQVDDDRRVGDCERRETAAATRPSSCRRSPSPGSPASPGPGSGTAGRSGRD